VHRARTSLALARETAAGAGGRRREAAQLLRRHREKAHGEGQQIGKDMIMVYDEKRNASPGTSDLDGIRQALEKLMPRSLDDVVRANREFFQIGLATAAEVRHRSGRIEPADTKDTIIDWRIVAFRTVDPERDLESGRIDGRILLSLLGRSSRKRHPLITSEVAKIDFRNRLVQTRNSLYALGVKGEGEPPGDDLVHLCATTYVWGFGKMIGAPAFFY
jgi:hypothetical protein